jgi:hypothetical protein
MLPVSLDCPFLLHLRFSNPEKLATKGTQDTGQINVREYRRGKKKDNPEKLAI